MYNRIMSCCFLLKNLIQMSDATQLLVCCNCKCVFIIYNGLIICYLSDYASDVTKNARIAKRSLKRLKKRMLTIEIFTLMDYSLYKK